MLLLSNAIVLQLDLARNAVKPFFQVWGFIKGILNVINHQMVDIFFNGCFCFMQILYACDFNSLNQFYSCMMTMTHITCMEWFLG